MTILCGLPHNFWIVFISLEVSQTSCVNVTQSYCNVFLLFPSWLPTSFESLTTHSHSCVVCTVIHFFVFLFFCSSPSWSFPALLAWLSHKLPVMFFHRFEGETPLSCFLLSQWRSIIVITSCGANFSINFRTHSLRNCPAPLVELLHKFPVTFSPCIQVDTPF